VTRPEFDPVPHALSHAQYVWLCAIGDGIPLEPALERATAEDPDFDLGPILTLLVQQNALIEMTTPKGMTQ
jgi:hypothetical protein